LVQGFVRLLVTPGEGRLEVQQLRTLLSGTSSVLMIESSPATREQVEAVVRPREDSRWLERALRNVREEHRKEKRAYEKWRGVRDLDEAHGNLRSCNRITDYFSLPLAGRIV